MSKDGKRPATRLDRPDEKQVRLSVDPDAYSRTPISWRVRFMDRVHDEWGWDLPNDANRAHTLWNRIHSAMKGYETMTWAAIDQKKSCHPWPDPYKLPKKAQDALTRLGFKLEQLEGLYQLSTGNLGRLLGIRDRTVFSILWWDPNHTFYPTQKR